MKFTTKVILAVVLSQCLLSTRMTDAHFLRNGSTKRQLKEEQQQEQVERDLGDSCSILLFGSHVEQGEKQDKTVSAACEMDDGSIMDLSQWSQEFVNEQIKMGLITSAESRLRLTELNMNMMDPSKRTLNVPEDKNLILRPLPTSSQRKLAVTEGDRTVLIVRAQSTDSSVTSSATVLSTDILGTAPGQVSMSSQYSACSHGKLNFVKAAGRIGSQYSISNGVTTVPLDISASATTWQTMRDLLTSSLKSNFGVVNPGDLANHVMYILPPGTAGFAASQGAINHWMTVFPDSRSLKQSSQMHELGHNLNVAHAAEAGYTYGDDTGVMGGNDEADDGPQTCFNAAHSWQLGWYSGKASVLDATSNPTFSGPLSGIVDYSPTSNQVLLKIQSSSDLNYYVNFNKAAGFNSGTKEAANMVTVVQKQGDSTVYQTSNLVAKLGAGNSFVDSNFDGAYVLTVSVSSISSSYATVSVSIGSKCVTNTDCNDNLFCNGIETCSNGGCVAGAKPCTTFGEVCNELSNQCELNCQAHSDCNDGLYCNGVETCQNNKCVAGTAPVCDDGIFCNGMEMCDEGSKACVDGPDPVCNDGKFCNGLEFCSSATDSCESGTPVTCDSPSTCGGEQVCDDTQSACVDKDIGFGLGNDGICNVIGGETCSTCAGDCQKSFTVLSSCGNGVCEDGEDCRGCPQDCNGKTSGNPNSQFCCSGGPGGCSDSQCNVLGSFKCSTEAKARTSCCGDGTCEGNENTSNCPADCKADIFAEPTTTTATTTAAATTSATTAAATTSATTTSATVPVNSVCDTTTCQAMDKNTCSICSSKCNYLNGKNGGCYPK